MRVLKVFFIFLLRRPRKSLRLSYEAIARAALLSRGTVGRTIQRLANLGLITVQAVASVKSPRKGISAAEPQTTR